MKLGGSLERSRGRRWRWTGAEGGPQIPRLDGNILMKVAGLALVGWIVGYVLSTRVLFPAPPPPDDLVEVPDVRGLGLASARELLNGAGLTLGPIDSLLHPSVAEEVILGQSPLPGQVARPEAPVRVTISLGPQRRSVPDVTGLDESRARIVLETSGFPLIGIDTAESEEPRGRVIEVLPPPGQEVVLPGQVRLVVSTGPPLIVMPFVLGLIEEEAVTLLDSLGLLVEVEEAFRFGRDQGIVFEQDPGSDLELARGDTVRLKVGRRGLERGNND